MKLTNQRINGGTESTIGAFFIDGKFACFLLEDERREVKVKGETRIPAGTYKVILRKEGGHHERYSKKYPAFHKGMLWLQDVPNFQFILIHIGNDDGDTEGCLLVGDGVLQNITGSGGLSGSATAYERIYPVIANELEKGNMVTIEIFDEKKY